MLKLLSIVENTTLGLVRNFDILQDYIYIHTHTHTHIYRVSQEECAKLRESVP